MTQRVDTRVLLMSRTLVLATQTPPSGDKPHAGVDPSGFTHHPLSSSTRFIVRPWSPAPLEPCAPGTLRHNPSHTSSAASRLSCADGALLSSSPPRHDPRPFPAASVSYARGTLGPCLSCAPEGLRSAVAYTLVLAIQTPHHPFPAACGLSCAPGALRAAVAPHPRVPCGPRTALVARRPLRAWWEGA